jgi:Leucine-rich repeat (LRR) protein
MNQEIYKESILNLISDARAQYSFRSRMGRFLRGKLIEPKCYWRLDLSSQSLGGLSLNPRRLDIFRKLSLHGNNFSEIPEFIGELENLSSLDISGNQLSSIPSWIGRLSNLRELDLSDNQIPSIPDNISKLTNLKKLCLEKNQITTIPEYVGDLANLLKLDISFNPIKEIHPSIYKLPLEMLRINTGETWDLHNSPAESPEVRVF